MDVEMRKMFAEMRRQAKLTHDRNVRREKRKMIRKAILECIMGTLAFLFIFGTIYFCGVLLDASEEVQPSPAIIAEGAH